MTSTGEFEPGDDYVRTVKVSISHLTNSKKNRIKALIQRYRAAVNRYIDVIWKDKDTTTSCLNKETFIKVTDPHLTQRQLSGALYQALNVIKTTLASSKALQKKHKKKKWKIPRFPSKPIFKGHPVLSSTFVVFEPMKNSKVYDYCIRLSLILKKKRKKFSRVVLPFKGTKVLKKWMTEGEVIHGCEIREDHLLLWIKIEGKKTKEIGKTIAFDTNYNHLLVDNENKFYADAEWEKILNRLKRRKKGSNGFRRAQAHRKNYVNRLINKIDWQKTKIIGIDDLRDLKKGKRNSTQSFRKARAPWQPSQVRIRILQKCQENRVYPVIYDPRNTSIGCPSCKKVNKLNREGESFKCVACGYTAHADFVGALNGFDRTLKILGSVESPSGQKPMSVIGNSIMSSQKEIGSPKAPDH